MSTLIFIIFCLILKLVINDYKKPVISELDQLINNLTEKKTVKYISNGIELKSNFISHYLEFLDMRNTKRFNRELIFKQAQKQHTFFQEDINTGYLTRCSKKDIILAESYILEYYDYVVHLN